MTKYQEDRYAFLEKLGVGFDSVFEVMDELDQIYFEGADEKYPPYNIIKTSKDTYTIELSVAGYKKSDIKAKIDGFVLSVHISGKYSEPDPEGDDKYFHRGIAPDDQGTYIKFLVAKNLDLISCDYRDGMLFFKFKDTVKRKESYDVKIGPFEPEKKVEEKTIVQYNSKGEVIGESVISVTTTGDMPVLEPVIISSDHPEYESTIVVVNADDKKVPTTEVVLPDPVPQIVEIKLDAVEDKINTKTEAPQATIVVEPAMHEIVSDDVVIEVIKTEEGSSDIVVAIPEEVAAVAEEKGIDIVADIKAAIEVHEPDLPAVAESTAEVSTVTVENVTVEIPEVVAPVMEVVMEDNAVILKDVSENIPENAELVPVITMEGQPDIVVAVTPEVKEELAEAGITDVATTVSEAVVEAETEVVVPVPAEEAPAPVEASQEPVTEVVSSVVNAEDTSVPTTEVVLPDPVPQIVEVSVENVVAEPNTNSSEPQATIVVEPATYEVSDNVTTEVIKTEEGKADIVVAIPEEVAAVAEEKGIDIVADIKAAIDETHVDVPYIPDMPTATVETVEIPVATDVQASVPEVVTQVMEVTTSEVPGEFNSKGEATSTITQIELKDVSENIPENAELVPVVTMEGEPDIVVAVTPEVKEELAEAGITDVAKTVSEAVIEAESTVVKADMTTDVVIAEEKTEAVIVNAEDTSVPTTEVIVPEVLPQIVEVALENVQEVPSTSSEAPQATIVLNDAVPEIVSDNVTTEVIKTEEGKADIVVAIPEEVAVVAEEKGIDIVADIKAAIEVHEPEAPVIPEAAVAENVTVAVVNDGETTAHLEVTTPDVITPVMEAVLVEPLQNSDVPAIELKDVSENVPENAELVPVITMEGQPDIVVAVTPEVKEELADINIAEDISKALIEAQVEVTVPPSGPPEQVVE